MSFSKKVRDKDGRRCRICDCTDDLTAHHLYPQSRYPKLKNVLVNGITLCDDCHKRYHHDVQVVNPKTFIKWSEQQTDLITENRLKKICNLCGALERYIVAQQNKAATRSDETFDDYMQSIRDVSIQLPAKMYEQLQTMINKKYQMPLEVYLLHFVKYQLKIN